LKDADLVMRLVEMLCRPSYNNTNANIEFDYEGAAEELGLTIEKCELVAGPQCISSFLFGRYGVPQKVLCHDLGQIGMVHMGPTAGDVVSYIIDQDSAFILRSVTTEGCIELVGRGKN
jgi:hypothetical protein